MYLNSLDDLGLESHRVTQMERDASFDRFWFWQSYGDLYETTIGID